MSQLGLIGAITPTSSVVPRARTPSADNLLQREFNEAGQVADADVWSKYATVMKRPTTIEQTLNLWEEMASWDLMAAALSELVEEAAQTDPSNPGTLWYECNDARVEEQLNDMAADIKSDDNIPSQIWHIAALGNDFEKIEYARGEGVLGLTYVHPTRVRRYWLEKNRRCIGFRWDSNPPLHKDDAFVMADGITEIPRASLQTSNSTEQLWYPWDFLHFRRMFRARSSEYGEALYDDAQGIYKKLRMAVDQMVVHRAQVQPDRYVVNVDVQDLPPTDQMKTIQRWKQSLRTKQSFGQGGDSGVLSDPTEFRSFYNPLALDTVLWMAKPKGFQHSIEKLAGTANVPDVYDIELLTDLFCSIIGMPKSWLGIGADGQNPPSGKALLAQDIRFLRKVKSIRKPLISQYTWLGYFHMVLKGHHDLENLNIKAQMSDIGGLEDQMKMELLDAQADILSKLGDVMDRYALPKEAWVELIFKRYLRLPDEVVNVFLTALPAQQQPMPMENRQRTPSESQLLTEIGAVMARPDVKKLAFKIKKLAADTSSAEPFRPRKFEHVIQMPKAANGDRIRVTLNDEPMIVRADDSVPSGPIMASMANLVPASNGTVRPIMETMDGMPQNWRKFMKV